MRSPASDHPAQNGESGDDDKFKNDKSHFRRPCYVHEWQTFDFRPMVFRKGNTNRQALLPRWRKQKNTARMVLTEERNSQEWRDDRSVGSSTNPFDEDYIDQQQQLHHRKSSAANVEPSVTRKNPFGDAPTAEASGPKGAVPSSIGATTRRATSQRGQQQESTKQPQEQEASPSHTERSAVNAANDTPKVSTNPFDTPIQRSDSYDSSGSSDRTVDSLDSAPMVTPSPPGKKKKPSSSASFLTSATSLTNLSDVENRLLSRLNHQYDEQERPRRIRRCDVPPLRREYDTMRKHLRAFTQAARKYKDATKHMAKSQIQVRVKTKTQSHTMWEKISSSLRSLTTTAPDGSKVGPAGTIVAPYRSSGLQRSC